ncbi:MAG: UDP-3-O-(3-hydroxymyristoyl)glucosamine N-acyltransferase [Bacteroidetes bacterium]|nr:UDP-3-O-(3-hydroxymyristoyl)glucosamine N-acyltransferase [Bacteroidota bacterium]
MEFTAEQIAGILNGVVEGNPTASVSGLSKIEEGVPGSLSFLANPKYEEYIYQTKSTICIVNKTFEKNKELPGTLTLVRVDDAHACFAKLLEVYSQMTKKQAKIEEQVHIDEKAILGENLFIGAFSYISAGVKVGKDTTIYPQVFIGENVTIGENCTIHPGAKIYNDCKIGDNCTLHAGVVIGADGFGFVPDEKGVFSKVPQIGNVVIEDNVEIGSNSTIDRATLGSTFIRKGVKIDNLVHIAHNVDVGENSAMAAQVGIAGSTKIGRSVMIGGQAGISGHITIADQTRIVAQSGIPGNVRKAETLMGSPGIPMEDFKKSYFGFRKLPYILTKLQELEQKLKSLTKE